MSGFKPLVDVEHGFNFMWTMIAKTHGTTQKITRVCAVVTGQYHTYNACVQILQTQVFPHVYWNACHVRDLCTNNTSVVATLQTYTVYVCMHCSISFLHVSLSFIANSTPHNTVQIWNPRFERYCLWEIKSRHVSFLHCSLTSSLCWIFCIL